MFPFFQDRNWLVEMTYFNFHVFPTVWKYHSDVFSGASLTETFSGSFVPTHLDSHSDIRVSDEPFSKSMEFVLVQ